MSTIRRHDIDWMRVIAIGLLLVYHVAIGFQPWGIMIGFITNDEPWLSLWIPMGMLNVWRIPFLFFVSGMGVYFSMQRRNWKGLLQERALRIFLPYLFGMFCIVPISVMIWQYYNKFNLSYAYNPGHLWFLGNIFLYVVVLLPILYLLKNNRGGRVVGGLRQMFQTPLGLIPFIGLFILEVMLIQPMPYELYAMTWHGVVLGFLAFLSGVCFVVTGEVFWMMIQRWRWMFVLVATVLFGLRLMVFEMRAPDYLLVLESQCWIFSVFAFGSKHLNRGGKVLQYLSGAAYPVYIVHMIFLSLGSILIFPLDWTVQLKFVALLVFTLAGCFGAYEIIKRIPWVRLLFGVASNRKKEQRELVVA